jgi:hypothetical protein
VSICVTNDEVSVEPKRLNEASFFEFVADRAPRVVFLSCHRVHTFSDALPERLRDAGVEAVSFGSLTLFELFHQQSVLEFLARSKAGIAAPYPGVLPGYYLFFESELLAYDAGMPARADVNHLLRGAALGAVLYGTTGRPAHILSSLVGAANGAVSQRLARDFAQAVAARGSGPRQAESNPSNPSESELHWAYRTLGVEPNASDAEVNQAWRKLRATHHPDHAGADAEEFARRSLRSRELNHARDLIFAYRTGQRRAA